MIVYVLTEEEIKSKFSDLQPWNEHPLGAEDWVFREGEGHLYLKNPYLGGIYNAKPVKPHRSGLLLINDLVVPLWACIILEEEI